MCMKSLSISEVKIFRNSHEKKKKKNPTFIHVKHGLLPVTQYYLFPELLRTHRWNTWLCRRQQEGNHSTCCHWLSATLLPCLLSFTSSWPCAATSPSHSLSNPLKTCQDPSACCSFSWCGGSNLRLQALNKIFNVWGVQLVNTSLLHEVWPQEKQKCILKLLATVVRTKWMYMARTHKPCFFRKSKLMKNKLFFSFFFL